MRSHNDTPSCVQGVSSRTCTHSHSFWKAPQKKKREIEVQPKKIFLQSPSMIRAPPQQKRTAGQYCWPAAVPPVPCAPAQGGKYIIITYKGCHQPSQSYQLQIHTGMTTAYATPAARTTLVLVKLGHAVYQVPVTLPGSAKSNQSNQIKSNQREARKKPLTPSLPEGDPP